MKNILKIIGEVIAIVGFLYGLCKAKIIGLETAITIGIISFIFLLCFQELKIFSIEPIKNAVSEIQKWLADNFDFVPLHEIKPTGLIKERSPLELTKLGKQLLEESGAKQLIDNNYDELKGEIDESNCKNAYDVQVCASKLIAEREDKNFMTPIKNFVYKNPKWRGKNLTLLNIERLMVIYLRNEYLIKHQDLPR